MKVLLPPVLSRLHGEEERRGREEEGQDRGRRGEQEERGGRKRSGEDHCGIKFILKAPGIGQYQQTQTTSY